MAAVTSGQLKQFAEEGYLIVEDVLDPMRDIEPLIAEYNAVLDGIAQTLCREGAISSTHHGLAFGDRLIRVYTESGRNFPQHFDISLPQAGIRPDTPIHVGPAVFRLLTCLPLLDVVQDIIGTEIYSNPVQHIRMKPPRSAVATGTYSGLVSKIPWHQDNGVILPEADEATILTVWLPLSAATIENGCLQVIPRSHLGTLVPHCPTDQGVAIPERLLDVAQAVPIPMRPGSVLLMAQHTIHSSLENLTENEVRLSLDLRYQPTGQPTGRPAFPGFVARSLAHPESELRDPEVWAQRWYVTRDRLADQQDPGFNRWRANFGACA